MQLLVGVTTKMLNTTTKMLEYDNQNVGIGVSNYMI